MPFFFIFFCSTFWSDNIKKKVFRLLVLIKSDDFCRHFYFYSPLFFPWEEEDEGRFIIIFGRLSCVSIVTRARLERTKEEEALTHLSTERERERERGATDDHHLLGSAARSVLLFFGGGSSILVVVVDSFAAAKGVALTTRLDRRRQSRPSFRARARTRFERKKDTPSPPGGRFASRDW